MTEVKVDSQTSQLILKLASRKGEVKWTRTARDDLLQRNFNQQDVLDAICQWIVADNDVRKGITSMAPGHVGETHYVLMPKIKRRQYFVKVGIYDLDGRCEALTIISVHPPRR